MASRNQSISTYFKGVQRRVMDTAQRRLQEMLPDVMLAASEYIYHEHDFGDMTGNWINSFGLALYRDGRFVEVITLADAVNEGAPIQPVLQSGDSFNKGQKRHDEKYQKKTFVIDGIKNKGSHGEYFADEKVVSVLRHTHTGAKGFSFRVVSVAEYHKEEAKSALLQISDFIESRGGNVWQFNLG